MEVLGKKRLLITGVSGLLGNNLAYVFNDRYNVLGLYNRHAFDIEGIKTQKTDLLDKKAVQKVIRQFDPDIVVHCAAISDVDLCEKRKDWAVEVNVEATNNIVKSLKGRKTKLVYISTDLVYSESNGRALMEKDKLDPVNHYGQTKYQGELKALKHKDVLILRINIFGWNIQKKFSLAEWVLHELSRNKKINGFKDTIFSGIYTFDLAEVLDKAIAKRLKGIYNVGSRNSMSKFDFAVNLAELFGYNKSLIVPALAEDVPLRAKRRKNLSLDVRKMEKDLKIKLPTMEQSLKNFYDDFQAKITNKIRTGNYPRLDYIPYGRQSISDEDIEAVIEVLKSNNLTQGPKVGEFERELGHQAQSNYVVAVNSGTSALYLACLATGIKPGDEVITSPNSFVASANCIVYCGARPVFSDIDPKTYNISPEAIEKNISNKTKGIIAVHFAGQSCDMAAIRDIVVKKEKEYGHKIYIIEDASHALGSKYKETAVGSCRYSDLAVMSFHPVKHITTAEGGAVLTNDEKLFEKVWMLRSHGITSNPGSFKNTDNAFDKSTGEPNMWYYEQQDLGYNFRITDLQCALGLSQLKRLAQFTKRRRDIIRIYNEHFAQVKFVRTPCESPDCLSNFHLYVLLFDFEQMGVSRNAVMKKLFDKNILTQVHYIPIHAQPFYQERYGTRQGDYPHAEEYYQRCLSLPLYPEMTDQDVKQVINAVAGNHKGY